MSVEDARKRVAACVVKLDNGEDPFGEQRVGVANVTLRDAAQYALDDRKGRGRRPSGIRRLERIFLAEQLVYPSLGKYLKRNLWKLTPDDVLDVQRGVKADAAGDGSRVGVRGFTHHARDHQHPAPAHCGSEQAALQRGRRARVIGSLIFRLRQSCAGSWMRARSLVTRSLGRGGERRNRIALRRNHATEPRVATQVAQVPHKKRTPSGRLGIRSEEAWSKWESRRSRQKRRRCDEGASLGASFRANPARRFLSRTARSLAD
jgi:hypothetical protein